MGQLRCIRYSSKSRTHAIARRNAPDGAIAFGRSFPTKSPPREARIACIRTSPREGRSEIKARGSSVTRKTAAHRHAFACGRTDAKNEEHANIAGKPLEHAAVLCGTAHYRQDGPRRSV